MNINVPDVWTMIRGFAEILGWINIGGFFLLILFCINVERWDRA